MIQIDSAYSHMREFVTSLPQQFDNAEGVVLHKGRNIVKQFTVGEEYVIVKRFKRPNFPQRIVYTFFRPSKAQRAYEYAKLFAAKGIATPRGIAYMEVKHGSLFADGYFVSEPDFAPSLGELMRNDIETLMSLTDKLARFLAELHNKGILHGDLNISNILVHHSDDLHPFSLIDTNRTKFKKNPDYADCTQNLMRLTHNRSILEAVVKAYADLRKWDATKTFTDVCELQDRFDRRKRCLHRITFRK